MEYLQWEAEIRRVYIHRQQFGGIYPIQILGKGECEMKIKFKPNKLYVCLQILCVATFCSMFLPWFSFNVAVAGSYWGINALRVAWIPFLYMAMYLFVLDRSKTWQIFFMEVALIAVPCIFVYELMNWPKEFITSNMSLGANLQTALPGFWVATSLALLSLVFYQIVLLYGKNSSFRNK